MNAPMLQTSYSVTFCGDCLGSLAPDGSELVADPSLPIGPGDIVAVMLKPEGPYAAFVNSIGKNGYMGVCKLYLGRRELPSGEAVYLVGQINPPVISPIPEQAIETMHKVATGDLPADAPGLTDEDLAAVNLLLPFASDFEVLPINVKGRASQ